MNLMFEERRFLLSVALITENEQPNRCVCFLLNVIFSIIMGCGNKAISNAVSQNNANNLYVFTFSLSDSNGILQLSHMHFNFLIAHSNSRYSF